MYLADEAEMWLILPILEMLKHISNDGVTGWEIKDGMSSYAHQ